MDNNYRNKYNEEKEIDLIDLTFYLLKQWKSLVVILVLGALLGAGIFMVKKPAANEVAVIEMIESEEDIAVVAEELEIAPDVLINMELASQYRKLYQEQVEYSQNSVLMRLDPNGVYKGSLKYYLSAGENTEIIGLLLQHMVIDGQFLRSVQTNAGLNCGEQYVKELLGSSLNEDESASINIQNIMGDRLDDANNNNQSVVLSYTFTYSDEKTCEKVLELIRAKVDQQKLELQEIYGEFALETVFDGIQFLADNSRLDKQKGDIDVLNTCLTNITKLEKEFTEEERAYYESIYLGRVQEQTEIDAETKPAVTVKNEVSIADVMKWPVMGVVLAVVCWGAFYLLKYLLDEHVKYAEELSDYYGLSVIGRYQNPNVRVDYVERWRQKYAYRRGKIFSSKEYIASVLNLMNEEKIYFVGNVAIQEIKMLMQELAKQCSNASYGDLLQNNSDSMENAKECSAIVLIIQKGKTMHTEVQRELELCQMQGYDVAGTVVVE